MNRSPLSVALLLLSSQAFAISGKEVMTKNEEARRLQDMQSTATLTTGGGGGAEKVKQFTWWRKLTSDGVHFNTLTRFHKPAEIKGQGILFLERPSGESDVQMYLPTYKKIRRVETQAQSGSFMGSEFSYSDIATLHVDDYAYKVLKESETCPTTEAAAVKCHVVESKPANDKTRERTGYSKIVTWVRSDNFMTVKADYFDADEKPWKKMEAGEIRLIDKERGKWLAHKVRMDNLKNGKMTLLEFAQVKANAGIADSVFTPQNLSRE